MRRLAVVLAVLVVVLAAAAPAGATGNTKVAVFTFRDLQPGLTSEVCLREPTAYVVLSNGQPYQLEGYDNPLTFRNKWGQGGIWRVFREDCVRFLPYSNTRRGLTLHVRIPVLLRPVVSL